MNKVIETIMKGVKRNERKILSIGTGVSIVLFGFSVWFKKDKIVGHFERTREKRNSDDPKERREGNVELAKGVVWDGLPVAASFALAEACVAGSYVASTNAINEAISTGVEALSEMTAVAYHGSTGRSGRDQFVKPYDDGPCGTIHDIQNQTSYVSARDVLIRDAIANGYQLAYFKPTGSYIFYKGNIDDLLEVANAKIKSTWSDSSGVSRSVTMVDVHDAFGITDTGDNVLYTGFIAKDAYDEAPTFYKQRPDGTHGVNSVMWEIYTNKVWNVGDKYHDYRGDFY